MSSQSYMGMLHLNGNGVPQDYAEAVKWFRKATEQEDIPAMFGRPMVQQAIPYVVIG